MSLTSSRWDVLSFRRHDAAPRPGTRPARPIFHQHLRRNSDGPLDSRLEVGDAPAAFGILAGSPSFGLAIGLMVSRVFTGIIHIGEIIDWALTAAFALAATASALADSNSAECLAAKEASAKVEVNAQEDRAKYSRYFDAFEGEQRKYIAKFDVENAVVLMGTVTEFRWTNPHAEILLTVRDEPSHPEQ
jgi:hypothetical protein